MLRLLLSSTQKVRPSELPARSTKISSNSTQSGKASCKYEPSSDEKAPMTKEPPLSSLSNEDYCVTLGLWDSKKNINPNYDEISSRHRALWGVLVTSARCIGDYRLHVGLLEELIRKRDAASLEVLQAEDDDSEDRATYEVQILQRETEACQMACDEFYELSLRGIRLLNHMLASNDSLQLNGRTLSQEKLECANNTMKDQSSKNKKPDEDKSHSAFQSIENTVARMSNYLELFGRTHAEHMSNVKCPTAVSNKIVTKGSRSNSCSSFEVQSRVQDFSSLTKLELQKVQQEHGDLKEDISRSLSSSTTSTVSSEFSYQEGSLEELRDDYLVRLIM